MTQHYWTRQVMFINVRSLTPKNIDDEKSLLEISFTSCKDRRRNPAQVPAALVPKTLLIVILFICIEVTEARWKMLKGRLSIILKAGGDCWLFGIKLVKFSTETISSRLLAADSGILAYAFRASRTSCLTDWRWRLVKLHRNLCSSSSNSNINKNYINKSGLFNVTSIS